MDCLKRQGLVFQVKQQLDQMLEAAESAHGWYVSGFPREFTIARTKETVRGVMGDEAQTET